MKISLIITTYNWPEALCLSLMSAARQTHLPDEVIVADDGSGEATRQLIDEMRRNYPCTLKHAWQENRGFRLAESRNNALRMCEGDYVIFVDGDIIMERHFVADHARMAKKGYYVIGSRVKLKPVLTRQLITHRSIRLSWYSSGLYSRANAFYLPMLGGITHYYKHWDKLYGRGCNMAVFMHDLRQVNGFEASLEGYGYEDTDIIARLNNLGLKKRFAKFRAIEYHLFHKEKAFVRDNEAIFKRNMGIVACKNGIEKL